MAFFWLLLRRKAKDGSLLEKRYRLRDRSDFRRVFDRGRSFANRYLVVYCLRASGPNGFRVGFSVSKKVGKAVTRNRVKRRLREVVREVAPEIRDMYDFVIIARPSVVQLDYQSLKKNVRHLLNGVKLLKR